MVVTIVSLHVVVTSILDSGVAAPVTDSLKIVVSDSSVQVVSNVAVAFVG